MTITNFENKELRYIYENVIPITSKSDSKMSFQDFRKRIVGTYVYNETRGSEDLIIQDFIENLSNLVRAINASQINQ